MDRGCLSEIVIRDSGPVDTLQGGLSEMEPGCRTHSEMDLRTPDRKTREAP